MVKTTKRAAMNPDTDAAIKLAEKWAAHRIGKQYCLNSLWRQFSVNRFAIPLYFDLRFQLESIADEIFPHQDSAKPSHAALLVMRHEARREGRVRSPMPPETAKAVQCFVAERLELLSEAVPLLRSYPAETKEVLREIKVWRKVQDAVAAAPTCADPVTKLATTSLQPKDPHNIQSPELAEDAIAWLAAIATARTRKQLEAIRYSLPYGQYILSDGGRVLYNRRYEPIVGFTATGEKFPASGWIKHVAQDWFYGGSDFEGRPTLATYRSALRRLVAILDGAQPLQDPVAV